MGVLIHSPYISDRFHDDFGVSLDEFISALKIIMDQVRRPGADSFYSYWKKYLKQWNIDMTEQEFYDYCFSTEKEVPETIEIVRQLKHKGIQIIVLSNNYKERTAYYDKHFKFLKQLVDKVYYSWQVGYVKPDPKYYRFVLSENKLDPKECVYFDDNDENIKVALNLGISSHKFTSTQNLIKKLNTYKRSI